MILDGVEHKYVYGIDSDFALTTVAFSKKRFKTKEDAVNKFKEMLPTAEIDSVRESYVRFLWWTQYEGYEYRYGYPACGFKEVKQGGKGAMDCWIIAIKFDDTWGWDYF